MEENTLYILVNGLDENSYSAKKISCVINEKMLKDPKYVGLVKWIGENKEPKKSWDKHATRILTVDGLFLKSTITLLYGIK